MWTLAARPRDRPVALQLAMDLHQRAADLRIAQRPGASPDRSPCWRRTIRPPDGVDHRDVGEPQHHRGAAGPRVHAPPLPIAASMCRIRKASPSSVPRMRSTSGMRPIERVRDPDPRIARRRDASTVRAPSPPWQEQHRPSADRSRRGSSWTLAAGHARAARHGMLDAGRDEEEVARARAGRLGAGTPSQASPSRDEAEDGVVLSPAWPVPRGDSSLWQ